ncbi:MAG TPA: hypothetical protein VGP53_01295 [Acidimicrobiales bacterium]|nr:hypothetical protein [Acidimicrobiales bacterium]
MTDERSPLEQTLDLLVYAPLGMVLTARTQLPDLVAKGRAQIEGQVTVARFIGQFAVKQGRVEVEKRLKAFTDPPAPAPEPVRPPVAEPGPVVVETPPEAPASAATAPAPPAADLAIPGYDALSASQVVQRLAGLAPAELEQVRVYEAATRGRKTVLTKITQLP